MAFWIVFPALAFNQISLNQGENPQKIRGFTPGLHWEAYSAPKPPAEFPRYAALAY